MTLQHSIPLLVFLLVGLDYTVSHQHTNFVIVGGTGDLAKKYLWNSALQLFSQNADDNNTFSFYAGSRLTQDDGNKALTEILQNVKCRDGDTHCTNVRPAFLLNSNYVELKSSQHYSELCETFRKIQQGDKTCTIRKIFYFSIPSSAYESVAKNIYDNCRDIDNGTTQVVLEKPFGHDKESASHQASVVDRYFSSDETYRVDHYLAKSVTKHILSFRSANDDVLRDLMTSQYVDRVEIVMKEVIGVKGRIDFYDQNGVVRDVMQNHLTELLALVAMELPNNVSDSNQIEKKKMALLQQIRPVNKNSLLIGQYSKYLDDAMEEKDNISQSYATPTFAAALLHIENSKWRNVPFIILSGKHMDERSSYIRFLFREREFCVSGCAGGNSTQTMYPRQIIFQLGHGSVPSPGVLVSKSLFTPNWPSGLKQLTITSKDSLIHGQNPGDFHYAVTVKDIPAYDAVLSDLYHGVKETFVTTSRMLQLWNIWDKVLDKTKSVIPRLYKGGQATNLNFKVENKQLKYVTEDLQVILDPNDEERQTVSVLSNFRNGSLTVKEISKLLQSLSEYILSIAKASIQERKVFHLALSGGSTPIALFQEIVSNLPLFPWEHTHIWQVDERCVSHKNSESNFLSLYESLLKFVDIPYFNIHPMPISFAGKICDKENKGDNLYEDLIKHLIPAQSFDFILLGIGIDGHTASLFPENDFLKEENRLVSYTKSKRGGNYNRMSLLLPVINNAREVTVLVTGKDKHDILHNVAEIESTFEYYPITYVLPIKGHMSWFVDLDAWSGK